MSIHLNEHCLGLDWRIRNYACFKYDIDFTDEDIWEIASGQKDVPQFENIYMRMVLSELKHHLSNDYPKLDIDYFINGLDTHLYINGEQVWDLESYLN